MARRCDQTWHRPQKTLMPNVIQFSRTRSSFLRPMIAQLVSSSTYLGQQRSGSSKMWIPRCHECTPTWLIMLASPPACRPSLLLFMRAASAKSLVCIPNHLFLVSGDKLAIIRCSAYLHLDFVAKPPLHKLFTNIILVISIVAGY